MSQMGGARVSSESDRYGSRDKELDFGKSLVNRELDSPRV